MNSKVLKMLMTVWALHIVVFPFSNAIAVLLGYLMLILSAVLPIDMLIYGRKKVLSRHVFIVGGLLMVIFINSLTSLIDLDMYTAEEYIKALVSFLSFIFTLSVGGTTYSQKDLDFYFKLNRILSFIFVIYTVVPFGFRYVSIDAYGNTQFTLSMGNPNATAVKVMFCLALLMIQYRFLTRRNEKIINGVLAFGLMYTLYLLESRTALLCAIVGIIVIIVVRARIKRWMLYLCWAVPVLFIPIQLVLERFPIIHILGKTLTTGRERMFAEFISEITNNPLSFILGNFAEYRMENYHNIFFTLLYNIGIVGIILYFAFWFNETRNIDTNQSKMANMAWIIMAMFIIHSASETAALSGAFAFGVMVIFVNRLTKDVCVDAENYLTKALEEQ